MAWLWWVLLAVVVLVLGLWLWWTAHRLDLMHHRIEVSRAALDAQLLRRSGVAVELATSRTLDNPGVGVRAADEGRLERVVAEVVEEPAVAGHQPGVLDARDRLAHHAGGHGVGSRRSSAARPTAETMLT